MIRKTLVGVAVVIISLFFVVGSSVAAEYMTKCKNDGDCPEGYICSILPYNRAGTCLEEPKPKEIIHIYTGGFESKLTRDTVNKFLNMPIPFKDDNLIKAINKELGKPADSNITVEECMALETLNTGPFQIQMPDEVKVKDLYGLQFCSNLKKLFLSYNLVEDLSPIAGLTKLQNVSFRHNKVKSLEPIKNLINLQELRVDGNNIESIDPSTFANIPLDVLFIAHNPLKSVAFLSVLPNELTSFSLSRGELYNSVFEFLVTDILSSDITVLELYDFDMSQNMDIISGYENLRRLKLINATLEDISEIAGLTDLGYLDLDHNSISDLSPLMYLTKLRTLFLLNNQIDSIASLVEKAQEGLFPNWAFINVKFNPLIQDSDFDWHVETLESLGLKINY